ncbi:MAG: hypothetical protein ACLFR1_09820 [Spirochaetia bacterium]
MKIKNYLVIASASICIFTLLLVSGSVWIALSFSNTHSEESFYRKIIEDRYQGIQEQSQLLTGFIEYLFQGENYTREEVILHFLSHSPESLETMFYDINGNLLLNETQTPDIFLQIDNNAFRQVLQDSLMNNRMDFSYPFDFNSSQEDSHPKTSIHQYRIFPDQEMVVGIATNYRLSILRFQYFQEQNRSFTVQLLFWVFIAYCILTLPLTMVVYQFLKTRLIHPLYKIEQGLKALENHDFTYRLYIRSANELESISRGFNTTANSIFITNATRC